MLSDDTVTTLASVRELAGSSTQGYKDVAVYCALVPEGARGALASLHLLEVLPAAGAAAVVMVGAEADSVTSDRVVTKPARWPRVRCEIPLTLGGTVRGVVKAGKHAGVRPRLL